MIEAYLLIGVFVSGFLFISAEVESNFFSEYLGFESIIDAITNFKVIAAFLILVICWPVGAIRLIYSGLK